MAGFALVSLFSGAVHGADYWLKSGTTDWADANSYTNASGASPASVPGAADTVYLPGETFAVDSTSASFATLSGFFRLVPNDATRLVVTVPAATTNTLGCAFNRGGESGGGALIGELVKKGPGHLALGQSGRIRYPSTNYAYDYATRLTLEEGSLALPQDADDVPRGHYGFIVSSNGTTLVATTSPSRSGSQWGEINLLDLAGAVINETTNRQFIINLIGDKNRSSVISGEISGNIRFWSSGSLYFLGTNSTFAGGVTATGWDGGDTTWSTYGNIGVVKFGMKGTPSSIGTNYAHLAYNHAIFRYLGQEPDETDRAFQLYSPMGLDGGAYGALSFSGSLNNTSDSASNSGQHTMLFCGDSANPCTFSGKAVSSTGTVVTVIEPEFSFYMIKRGTGTWRFVGPKNGGKQGWNGGLAVEEGTLQFDSIAAAGTDCSLGTATKLTYKHEGAWTNGCWVSYAIALGSVSPTADAVLEYIGEEPASCSTRQLALTGDGGHLRTSHGKLLYSDIVAREANSSPTLTLDGTGTRSRVMEVADGAAGAKLNVAKEGTGIWTLGGNLTFSGDVTVREGTLNVKNPVDVTPTYCAYKRFRLSIAEIANGTTNESGVCGSSDMLNLRQIALFDKDGVRQNVGLTVPTTAYDAVGTVIKATELRPGEVCYGPTMDGKNVGAKLAPTLARCFDGSYGGTDAYSVQVSTKPDPDDESTWFVVDMCLPASANPITHFDIQSYQNSFKYVPQRFKMEASVNGDKWTTVWSNLDDPKPLWADFSNYNRWISDGVGGSASNRPLGKGFTLTKSGEVNVKKRYFNWFRLSVAKIENNSNDIYIRQIGLYDKFGNRVNAGLTLAEDVEPTAGVARTIASAEIGPGQCGYDPSVAGYKVVPYSGATGQDPIGLPAAFVGSTGESGTQGRYYASWRNSSGAFLKPSVSVPTTWIPIVMHLADGSVPVTQFDVQAFYYSGTSRYLPVRMKLEGSIDGENWVEAWSNLDEAEDLAPALSGYNQWMARKGLTSRADVGAKGFQLTNTYWNVQESYDQLQHVNAIEVKPGATFAAENPLAVKALRIDMAGAGTFSNLVFAASGNLDIVSAAAPSGVLPGTYLDCQDLANLAHWTVSINGTPKPGYELSVSEDGKITVFRPGLLIFVR